MTLQIVLAIVGGLLGGSAVAAAINQIGEHLRYKAKRKDGTIDKENEEIKALQKGLRYLLLHQIRVLGEGAIVAGRISFEDRRQLNEMHGAYHNDLGGNGDLDTLMEQINDLPLDIGQ